MNIYEMARKAKLSTATISRAMNLKTRHKVAPETLQKVDRLIRQHHYTPSLSARGLTQSAFHTIGVVVPHGEGFFMNEYYSTLLCGIADALLETAYRFKLILLKCGDRKWDRYNFRASEGVDGLILTHWHALFDEVKAFSRVGAPCVIIGDPESKVPAHFFSADQEQGGILAAEYFLRAGHRRFAVVAGGPFSVDSQLRLKGFCDRLSREGARIPKSNILCGEFQEGPAHDVFKGFLKKKPDVTAVFCLNDTMAYGVIRALREEGIKCPGNVSVMGFDDDSRAASFDPPLTTVRVPLYAVAREAAGALVSFLEKNIPGKMKNQQKLFSVEVVERGSVKKQ
jgi:LacI family transcriptional regulator